MAHSVYANNNEICSKSASGTSDFAVDVCFSPGAPMPGVPVTYMNTCRAGDITKGSRSVFIKDMEICLENKSYFRKSYGDEPATQALKRGIISTAVQGRCYFIGWSGNVFVEGKGVTRNLDLVTHNHSNPPNTPPVPYFSSANVQAKCKEDLEKIAKACAPDDEAKKLKKKKSKIPFAGLLGKKHGQAMKRKKESGSNWPGAWMEDHCDGLWIKPQKLTTSTVKKLKGELDALTPETLLNYAKDNILNLNNLMGFLGDKGMEVAINQGGKWAVRAAATHGTATVVGAVGAVGGPAVVVTEGAAHTVGVVVDIVSAVWSLGSAAVEIYQELDILGKIEDIVTDRINSLNKYKQLYASGQYDEILADGMEMMATLNACTRARRCMLVRYKDTNGAEDVMDGKGCCPGQSGHHILPDEMFTDRADGACPKYTKDGAPTICVEGTNNHHASHGKIHANLRDRINNYKKGALFGMGPKRDTIPVDDAIEMGARSIQNTFPESRCDKKCLIAQLEEYYKKRADCKDGDQLKAAAGVEGVVDPTPPGGVPDGGEE